MIVKPDLDIAVLSEISARHTLDRSKDLFTHAVELSTDYKAAYSKVLAKEAGLREQIETLEAELKAVRSFAASHAKRPLPLGGLLDPPEVEAELDAELREEGIDPDAAVARIRKKYAERIAPMPSPGQDTEKD